jgi:CRP-like cAMP-binding protein
VIAADAEARLRALIERDGRIPAAEWTAFMTALTERCARRHDYIVRPGRVTIWLDFVVEGVLRKYRVHDGCEVNVTFLATGSFAGDYASCVSDTPSECGIQAMVDSRLLGVRCALMRAFAERHRCWREFLVRAGARLHRDRERRQADVQVRTTEMRYRHLLERHPEVVRVVPHYHIASYLGITPESLSRLIARIQRGGQ